MDDGHVWTEKELKLLEGRIRAEYKQAMEEVQRKLNEYLEKFRAKDEIKRQELADGKITQKEYAEWRKGQIMMGKRWEEMRDSLARDFANAEKICASMTQQFSYDAYAMNHNYGTFEVEKGSLVDTSYTLYDRSTVERLIRDDPTLLPPPGKKVSRAIAEGRAQLWNKQMIQSVMTQSILQGESIDKIAKRLANMVGDSDTKAAIRNARTMTTGAENAGRVDSYKRAENMGIKMMQQWVATLDNRTRHEHRQLDGQRVKVGEPFIVGHDAIMFPGDPAAAPYLVYNCRCTLIGVVAGSDLEKTTNAGELPRRSKLGTMTYDEWKNEHKGRKGGGGTSQTPAVSPAVTITAVGSAAAISWVDQIRNIQSNTTQLTESDIMQVGEIVARETQQLRDEYIHNKEEIERLLAEVRQKLNNDLSQSGEALSLRSRLQNEIINAQISSSDSYKKFPIMLQWALEENNLNIKIGENETIESVMKKLDDYIQDKKSIHDANVQRVLELRDRQETLLPAYMNGLKAKLSELRPMGTDGVVFGKHLTGNKEMGKVVESAYGYYPTDWIRRSIDRGSLKVEKVSRGYYSDWRNIIAISGGGENDPRSLATGIHELGHRMERAENLLPHEAEFYKRRTAGEPLKWLGPGYDKKEVTRKDDFTSPYMGKDYGGGAFELCSMGFEYIWTKPEILVKDPEMQNWILGMLAVC